MAGIPSWPQFTSRQPVQFISDDSPSLSITLSNPLYNNPSMFKAQAGNTAQIAKAVDGTSKIAGAGEYSPFLLDLEWSQLGYNDYQRLSALVPYKLTFISFRNVGYYGMLQLNGPTSNKPYTADVVQCTGTFLVTGPSDDGGAASVNRIPTPTSFTGYTTAGSGFIPNSTDTFYWFTFHTKWGETDPQYVQINTGGSGGPWYNTLTWSWPSSPYCTYASIYCSQTSNPNNSLLMAEVLAGQTASWTDLVGWAGVSPQGSALYQRPPATGVNNAYKGKWAGAIWINGT